jgi:hypothetical protein
MFEPNAGRMVDGITPVGVMVFAVLMFAAHAF